MLLTRNLNAGDKHRIELFEWQPATGSPTCLIQLLHGLGEHAGRYDRFARACNEQQIAVIAHNHRGHGNSPHAGHYADEDGWDKVIADVKTVRAEVAGRYPGLSTFLFGHSMGSFIAQCFAMRHDGGFAGLILSGSNLAARSTVLPAHVAARAIALAMGGRSKNRFLNHAGLGKLNRRFDPARTKVDWLSRDEAEVDRYLADPLCGGDLSNQLWVDLTGGILEISSLRAIALVDQHLPILMLGGEDDPVGGREGLQQLARAYQETGHDELSLTLYPEGRHEMLNETNRDEVTRDILAWISTIR